MRNLSFTKRIALLLCIALLVPIALTSAISYSYNYKVSRDDYLEIDQNQLNLVCNTLLRTMSNANYAERSLYYNTVIINLLQKSVLSQAEENYILGYLASLLYGINNAKQIYLYSTESNYGFLVNGTGQAAHTPAYSIASPPDIQPYNAFVEMPHMLHAYGTSNRGMKKESVITLHWPIISAPAADRCLGGISVDLPLSLLEEIISPLCGDNEQVLLVDSTGALICSTPSVASIPSNLLTAQYIGGLLPGDSASVLQLQEQNFRGLCLKQNIQTRYLNWYVVKFTPESNLRQQARQLLLVNMSFYIACALAAIALVLLIIIRMTQPLRQLTIYANAVKQGNINEPISKYVHYKRDDEIGQLIDSIDRMLSSINAMYLDQYRLELENRTSQLKLLRAQVNPHFLYNALQCLGAIVLEKGNIEAYDLISLIGQMMRYSMDTKTEFVTLSQEFQYVDTYLKIQKIRFGSNLTVLYKIDPEIMDTKVPKMILQPLVENCFKHGGIGEQKPGEICISINIQSRYLVISVSDNGVGITENQIRSLREKLRNQAHSNYIGESIGLSNVLNRLRFYYKDCDMQLMHSPLGGALVEIRFAYMDRALISSSR